MARIPEFYKLSVSQRVREVRKQGLLSNQDYQALVSGNHTLSIQSADKRIENVIGVMGLPLALGLNFLINDKAYAIPLVVEEPSIVAALSSAAKIARPAAVSMVSRCTTESSWPTNLPRSTPTVRRPILRVS
jgi:hydroxymethylglutaryl-CoA reductase